MYSAKMIISHIFDLKENNTIKQNSKELIILDPIFQTNL